MSRQCTLPALLLDTPVVLPGVRLQLSQDDGYFKNTVIHSVNNYGGGVVVFYKGDNPEITVEEHPVGILASIKSYSEEEDGLLVDIELIVRAVTRGEFVSNDEGYIMGDFEVLDDLPLLTEEDRHTLDYIRNKILQNGPGFLKDGDAVLSAFNNHVGEDTLCDVIAQNLSTVDIPLYDFLKDLDFSNRLLVLAGYIDTINQQSEIDKNIEEKVHQEIDKEQKEYYLRKKIRKIQEELGDVDNATADADALREKINNAGMPEKIKEHALKELKRYQSTSSMSPEYNMIRGYLDIMLEIPWKEETTDTLDINKAKEVLDASHFGLEKVKDRILEYLSVKLYTTQNPQTIICFAGPPGVGKTTLARSIADALGRKFVKQSLGGVKDEAEIRGHRRTYIGALPGRIIDGMRDAKVVNPVFLLDEIDKLGADYKGDPSASLLEVLDPAQNVHFMDHYVSDEYDLSKVMFICTANYLEKIPEPLRDRMEIIELSSYTEIEKFHICKEHVIAKELKENGLEPEKFEMTDEAIYEVIKHYTREAGARQLERCIGSIVRKSIKKILSEGCDKVVVDVDRVRSMLGKQLHDFNKADEEDEIGVVNGLAYTQAGGDTLQVEAIPYKGKGDLKLTGKLGDVMKESAQIAYTWVKAHCDDYSIPFERFENTDIHIHCPEGAVPKDGPSAGVTLTTAIISALTEKPVRCDLGMTGEITLRGKVLPIGGLKEKSIAAHRAGLKEILIPYENIKDLDDIPEEVKSELKITPIKRIEEVLNIAFREVK